ncbi:hypothetical protein O7626_40300 [Micromonospora sp. WMMD1102]|uniref:hypothetical protein n=1 Tax=Micromonospora sp. WMMD1102 TaxID=3016105 RepID=UPI00241595BA|nr:hypothetical protein [Micromonospora sp. WMMD1102]MDG4792060.1 hypothetical protein [Micromonospora sp. WMMD1102]
MPKVTITRDEFNRFWDEVLGNDWCIEETDIPDQWWDGDDSEPITIEYLTLEWQVMGPREPSPTTWITARDLRDGSPNFFTLLKRWRGEQTTVTVVVEVPREREADLLAAVKELGGRVVS